MLERHAAERIHRVEDAYVNFYIVEDGPSGGVTVVDTGHPASWGKLHKALAEIGRAPQDVEAVVLTHGHFDHMGFARRAREELGVPVLAPEKERAVVAHPWRYDHERSRLPYVVEHPTFAWIFTRMGAAGALWVKGLDDVVGYDGGEVLDVPGRPEVVPTPGHTHGHCALHFRDRGAVISGDALVTLDPYTAEVGPRIVARAATADSAQALACLSALEETGAATVLPGHGRTWRGGAAEAVTFAREHGPR